jgi:predicted amidohydrolase YtcJ
MLYVLDLSYPNAERMADVIDLVRRQIDLVDSGGWVEGRGWDEGKLEELRYIYAADLDSISPDNPVWLSHTMGHYGVANSLALEMAGITADTPDPPGGTIDRFPDGTPTGVLKESAQWAVEELLPETTPEQIQAGMRALAEAFNREGMTGVKDPGIGQKLWEAYQDVLEDGNLTVRVFALWGTPETVEEARAHAESIASFTKPYESTGDDRVIAGGVKLYADGSGGARTAWLYDDWSESYTGVNEGNRGYPAIDAEILREQIGIYHDAGIHMSVHSIGDRAIDWVMDSYQMAMEANPISGLRHGIIHSNIPTDRALDAMAGLQRDYDAAYPEPSATFMWWIGDTYAGNFGRDRALRLNPFRTFLDKGIRWANGSDYSVTPFAARYGLWASLARKTLLGVYGDQPYGADEAVDIRTALRSHTIWAANQMFLEDKVGSIEVGKYADIAVWDRDLYTVPVDSLQNLTALMTVFNGRIVYRSPDAPADWPNE